MINAVADLRTVLEQAAHSFPPGSLTDLGSPSRTHVFIVGDIVVKFDAQDRLGSGSMVREGAALDLLAGTDLPVPRLLHAGQFADGRRWVVLNRLSGEPPEDALRPAHELSASLAEQMGGVIARLHAARRPPAFGSWTLDPRRSYLEEHWHRIGILESMAREARVVSEVELDALLALLRATSDPLDDVQVPVLAHRDVQPRNVLVDEGELAALLDFESAAGGDPAEDFRVIGLGWTSPAFAAFARTYAEAGGSLGPSGPDRVAHYVLEWALAVFAYLGRIAPAYLEPARTAVDRVRAGERPDIPGPPPETVAHRLPSTRTEVHRVGDAVHREAGAWSPAVHALLRHLEAVGFTGSPRVLGDGFDAEGRERLTYIEGELVHPHAWTDDGIAELGSLLRGLHDATVSFHPPADAIWQPWFTRSVRPDAAFGHGDLGPWNIVARDGRPVGFIDWEFAGPVERLDEVAQVGWLNAQLHDDDIAVRNQLPSAEERAHQLGLFVDAYGLSKSERALLVTRMVDHAVRDAGNEFTQAGGLKMAKAPTNPSDPAWAVAWRIRSAAWLVAHRTLLESAIGVATSR